MLLICLLIAGVWRVWAAWGLVLADRLALVGRCWPIGWRWIASPAAARVWWLTRGLRWWPVAAWVWCLAALAGFVPVVV